jgi:hypothetical protein
MLTHRDWTIVPTQVPAGVTYVTRETDRVQLSKALWVVVLDQYITSIKPVASVSAGQFTPTSSAIEVSGKHEASSSLAAATSTGSQRELVKKPQLPLPIGAPPFTRNIDTPRGEEK